MTQDNRFQSQIRHRKDDLVLGRWVLAIAAFWMGMPPAGSAAEDEAEKLFTLKIIPLLKDKCLGCHGADPEDIKGEFSILSLDDLLRGGESEEPAIVPGHPEQGTLIDAISWAGLEMPPKENDRLTPQQIDLFREWIRQGAAWPDEETQQRYRDQESSQQQTDEGVRVVTSGGTSQEWSARRYQPEDLWAFSPLKPMSDLLPTGVPAERAIDFFIDRKLERAQLTPASPATARQLILRASYDLTGLPPSPQEVSDFESAYAQNPQQAWAELIDRLLASPRYGEHWARHWLDVTRYADTGGMSNDYERSNMWRYRDYVIRAFNSDKPYDQFIVEQLAGDELADLSVKSRTGGTLEDVHRAQLAGDYNAEEAEWIVATGFLRLGPWDNAMVEEEEARQMYLDDLVNITGQTFLSQTLRCCKCHDHKFDPIPTRDYYSIYAAFATTQMAERPVPFLADEDLSGFEQGRAHVQRMLDFAVTEKDKLIQKRETAARAWFEERGLPYKNEEERKDLPDEAKPPRHVGLNHVEQGQLKVREQDEWIWQRRLERYEPMAQSVFNAAKSSLAWNGARKLRITRKDKSLDPPRSHILLGGALTALGDPVVPGVLSALTLSSEPPSQASNAIPTSIDGRRLSLARWIANPANSLTSRSIVNRIWSYHFGKGIAANPNNFGAKGAKPTHPELLDFLAMDFVQNGWKIKQLHRTIMLSDAYRRSTIPSDPTQVQTVDPNNQWLSYFPRRRLTAEEIRDAILQMSGELTQRKGGLPGSPEINMEVALQPRMIQFSLAPAYQPSRTPTERNCRSIYAYQVRGQADPFTEIFNQPNPNESCEMRESAAVTPQVFTLLNSDMMTDRSIAMALRLEAESADLPSQISRAFELILNRPPTAAESQRLSQYVSDMQSYHVQHAAQPPTYPTSITRSLVEEFSGQPFEYDEILPVFEAYVPDAKAADVSSSTRALADLCLLLFNSNEFMYVE
ncbi:MAG: PSD1 and planctomycete cytochrome C domain-containing protein [bacterium]|nr:PSD1 and planctomycete cytochrome C domain-containing protein [bacterium]